MKLAVKAANQTTARSHRHDWEASMRAALDLFPRIFESISLKEGCVLVVFLVILMQR